MSVLDRLRPHVEEAAYLYGFARSLSERLRVTWFISRKKLAQLRRSASARGTANPDVSIRLYGATHVFDLLGSEIYLLDEIYRERLYDRLDDFVPVSGSTVVDVGANVGVFAVRQARRGARVYAFEPNRDCFRRLSRTVVENGLTEAISVTNCAVGEGAGVGTLSIPNNQTALGSVKRLDRPADTGQAPIRITSLDQVLPALGVEHVDLLKIDTEGAEADVLRGAADTLRRTDRVVLEYHSDALRRQVGRLLGDGGFQEVLRFDTPAPYLPDAGMLYARRAPAG
jgi:FkbM family methyltransferase